MGRVDRSSPARGGGSRAAADGGGSQPGAALTDSPLHHRTSSAGPPPRAGEDFWNRPLETLSRAEWEALCDGCGQCCMHKLEDADTGEIHPTNVACKLLDLQSCRCTDYRHRRAFVPDCLRLTPRLAASLDWLPSTCAYRLRANGEPLPEWHYLVCGDAEMVHRAGVSIRGRAISETLAGPLEDHVLAEYDDDLP